MDRGLSSTSSSQSSLASLASLPPPPPLRPPDCSALLSPAAATGNNELPLFYENNSQAAQKSGGFCLQLPPVGRRLAAANASARPPSAVLRSVSFGQGERLAAASGREEEYSGGGLGSFTSVPLFGPFPVGWEPSLLRERPRTTTQRRPTEESTRIQPEVKQRQEEVNSCRSLSISSAGT